jgi:hypothetical protein
MVSLLKFRLAGEVAGTDLSAWFGSVFDSTTELDYQEALNWFGLRFAGEPSTQQAWLGADTEVEDGRLMVRRIPRGTPRMVKIFERVGNKVGYECRSPCITRKRRGYQCRTIKVNRTHNTSETQRVTLLLPFTATH